MRQLIESAESVAKDLYKKEEEAAHASGYEIS